MVENRKERAPRRAPVLSGRSSDDGCRVRLYPRRRPLRRLRPVRRLLPAVLPRGGGGRHARRHPHGDLRRLHDLLGPVPPASDHHSGAFGRGGVRPVQRRAARRAHLQGGAGKVRRVGKDHHGRARPALAPRRGGHHRQRRAAARCALPQGEAALLPEHERRAPRRIHPHAAALPFLPGRHVDLRHDGRTRKARHGRDLRLVPQGGRRRGGREDGGGAPHAAAQVQTRDARAAARQDRAPSRGGRLHGHARGCRCP